MNSDQGLARTAEFWDREHFRHEIQRAKWQNYPRARERLARLLGGRLRECWFVETYLPKKGWNLTTHQFQLDAHK